jgi:hypothetical protein
MTSASAAGLLVVAHENERRHGRCGRAAPGNRSGLRADQDRGRGKLGTQYRSIDGRWVAYPWARLVRGDLVS